MSLSDFIVPEGMRCKNTFLELEGEEHVDQASRRLSSSVPPRRKPDIFALDTPDKDQEQPRRPQGSAPPAPAHKAPEAPDSAFPRPSRRRSTQLHPTPCGTAAPPSAADGDFHAPAGVFDAPAGSQGGAPGGELLLSSVYEVPGRKLKSREKRLSGRLFVNGGGPTAQVFTVILEALHTRGGRGGSSFDVSKGHASVVLSTETPSNAADASLTLCVGDRKFHMIHNFSARKEWRVVADIDMWELAGAADMVPIHLAVRPSRPSP